MPSPPPSPAPTGSCTIDVAIDGCFNFTPIGDNNCEGRPVVITFRYNGGDCSQSDNLQDRQKFDCFDSATNPPPTVGGTTSYILATELGGGDVYFEGFVDVGQDFTLNGDRTFDKLSADMNITVYDPAGSTDPATIINGANLQQTVFVHLSCSQPLFLKDRFGAHQVVEWIEGDGRVVSCFIETETGSLTLSLNASSQEDPVRLLEMNVITNVQPEPINYTDQVNGVILQPGGSIDLAPINVTVDLTSRTRYTFFTTVIGETLDGSTMCNGFDFHECIAGVALPPFFPTLAPTPSPTITPFPTPDPDTTTCDIRATIECLVADPFGPTCESLTAPTATRCTAGAEISLLKFEYTGAGSPVADPAYIEITDCEKSGFFQGTAFVGDVITVNSRGNFLCDTIEVLIQTLDFDEEQEENNGDDLESFSLETACTAAGETWVLGDSYGSLRLVQYNSDLDGVNALTAQIVMNYAVDNVGSFGATISSALLNSAFNAQNPAELVGSPILVPQRSRVQLATQNATISLEGSAGTSFDFTLALMASSATTAMLPCDDFANYTFSV